MSLSIIDREIEKYVAELVTYMHKTKSILFDYTYLSFDNQHIFNFSDSNLISNSHFNKLYNKLLNAISKTYYIDVLVSFSDIVSTNLNSIFAYEHNIKTVFVKYKNPLKKSIHNLDILTIANEELKEVTIMIPILFSYKYENEKIKEWVKLLSSLINVKKIIIVNILDLFDNQPIHLMDNEKHINIIGLNLITKRNYFEILWKEKEISKNDYNKINMFINNDINSISKKPIINPLYSRILHLIEKKKSNICVSLEDIEDPSELIKYTNLLGEYIIAIKVNSNNIYNESLLKGLKKLAIHHDLVIIDDKKITIKKIEDMKQLNGFHFADIVSVNLDIITEQIEPIIENVRTKINKWASFLLILDDPSKHKLIENQYMFLNNYICGVIGNNISLDSNLWSFIDYTEVKNYEDNFISLRKANILVLENELYQSKNPLEIVKKINVIVNQNKYC